MNKRRTNKLQRRFRPCFCRLTMMLVVMSLVTLAYLSVFTDSDARQVYPQGLINRTGSQISSIQITKLRSTRHLADEVLSYKPKLQRLDAILQNQQSDYITEETAIKLNHTTHNSRSSSKMLLIVAYPRTGSTFTASLFTQPSDTFYLFEPLHMLHDKVSKKLPVSYLNGTVRGSPGKPVDPSILYKMEVSSIHHWLNCEFSEVEIPSLLDRFHTVYTGHMKKFLMCVKSNLTLKKSPVVQSINKCLPEPVKICSKARLRIIKTIRLSMEAVPGLLENNRNLKVIHLVRDPRGMFTSQYRSHLLKPTLFNEQFKKLCTRMSKDALVTKMLIQTGNENVKFIRYEDLANDPVNNLKDLYEFIKEPLTNNILKFVIENTSSNLKDNCMYCTRRGNSSLTAGKWRERVGMPFIRLVNRYCKDVYRTYGYKYMDSLNEIRDPNVSVTEEDIPFLNDL